MGRIRVLPDAIANKIAAGEVVERPASVVKELLENSLDAGSTEIRVDAEAGGRRLIRVVDNGVGMMRDDALMAFERHATSKLQTADDLFAIATLGFRGEALPSIASVSRLDLETRTREEAAGTRIEIAGAKMLRCDDFAREPGTTIVVRDLFYNVPARRKFLRSEPTELAHIASLVTHYALSRRDLSFELHHNGIRLLHAPPVGTHRERVFQIFGAEILADLIELPETASGGFTLYGFVSQPQIQKLNRNSIYLFVNGRLIRDRLLLHALTAAYHNLMPAQCYPFALLFLGCHPEDVDVNVHPAKTEVRFQQGSAVHDFVRDTVRQTLLDSRPASKLPLPAAAWTATPSAQPAVALPLSEFSLRAGSPPPPAPQQPQLVIPEARDLEIPVVMIPPNQPIRREPLRLPLPDTHGPLPEGSWADGQVSLDVLRELRVLGQLHHSFIVAAGRDGLWIIDQHVAHERILFEQAMRRSAAGHVERQPLLMPLVIPLTIGQQIEFSRIESELSAVGFDAEPFGARTLAIKAAPAGLDAAGIERAVLEILEVAENELRLGSLDDIRRGVCASVACRAAIKINTPLDPAKMEWLLTELAKTEFPTSCPHGRPIALRYSMRDILKGFHRI